MILNTAQTLLDSAEAENQIIVAKFEEKDR
jgi:hypothetical protein